MSVRQRHHRTHVDAGVGELVIDNPPVNALSSAGWRAFADAVIELGRRDDVNCLVIRAEGRGFQAGVDVKELAALIGVRLPGSEAVLNSILLPI